MEESKLNENIEHNDDCGNVVDENKLFAGEATNDKEICDVSLIEDNQTENKKLVSDENASINEELLGSIQVAPVDYDCKLNDYVDLKNEETRGELDSNELDKKVVDVDVGVVVTVSDYDHTSEKGDNVAAQTPIHVVEITEGNTSADQWCGDDEESDDSIYSYEEDDTVDEDDEQYDAPNKIQRSRRRSGASEQFSEEENIPDNEDGEDFSESENLETVDEDQLEGKRFSGDGQEEPKSEKKVDEDKKNPAYVPRKGTYFEHDLRCQAENDDNEQENIEKAKNKKKSRADDGKWKHDKFDVSEQAPKKTHEIVRKYGFDIRKTGRFPEDQEDGARLNGDYRKDKRIFDAPRDNYRRSINRPQYEADDNRSISPSNYPHRQANRYKSDDHRDVWRVKQTSKEQKKNGSHVKRGYRTEMIITQGNTCEDPVKENPKIDVENETVTHDRSEQVADCKRKVSPKRKDNAGIPRTSMESYRIDRDEDGQNRTRKYMPQRAPKDEIHDWGRDRDYVPQPFMKKGYSACRNQEQLSARQPFRDATHQRPPRLARQYADRPPRELEIVNSNVTKGKNKIMEEHLLSVQDVKKNNVMNNTINVSASGKDDSTTSISGKGTVQSSGVPESRKGWAGGEFTPSWRTEPQQRMPVRSDEDTNAIRGSKRYSSSRQQQKQHFRDIDYYQQYPQYAANSGATTGPVYDTMIPHPAYVPHSSLVTNSYSPFYSTLPGNVYANPPVYQHPSLNPYTNTSYVHHIAQEGPVFYGHQGVAQGQYFEPSQSTLSHMRATSAIPIVNPQDLATRQNQGTQPEAVTVRSQ